MRSGLAEAGRVPVRFEPGGQGGYGGQVLRFPPRGADRAAMQVLDLVEAQTGISPELQLSRNRRARVVLARQLAMYLMHVALGRRYGDVGRLFRRDRTTISHACWVVEELREGWAFDEEVARIEARLADAPVAQTVEAQHEAG